MNETVSSVRQSSRNMSINEDEENHDNNKDNEIEELKESLL
jgi:hypothetical protein